jgi:hypothetical protein
LRVPPSSFEGAAHRPYEKWVAQCHGADTGLTAQCRTVVGMASPGVLAEQRWDMIPKRVRGTTWCVFVFDLGACTCQNIKCSVREQVRGRRACESLERGGDTLEGVSSPRARGNLTRGGVQPSSEVELHPRGRPALERDGISIVWRCAPRAKRSFARGWLGLTVLAGRWGRQDRGPLPLSRDCLGCVLCL